MSFEQPGRLLILVAPLALLIAYVVAQRARRKYAVRFTSVDLLASVAPKRPGWQRHVSAALLILAVSALVVGFAQPTGTKRVPRQRGAVILAIDTSGSMAATDHAAALAAVNSLTVGGGTATGVAIDDALAAVAALPAGSDGKKAPAAIVLMSDGAPTIGKNGEDPQQTVTEATAAAKAAQVPVDTIAFGTSSGTITVQGETVPVPADAQTMSQIAQGSGGKSFTATTSNELNAVYDQIRKVVGFDKVPTDLTEWFVGLALVFAILTAGAALYWMQRIP